MRSSNHSDTFIAFDPGIRQCGLACFKAGQLVALDVVTSGNRMDRDVAGASYIGERVFKRATELYAPLLTGTPAWDFVYERQQVYNMRKCDPDDLFQLAQVNGAVGVLLNRAGCARTFGYLPGDWKGTVSKRATEARMRDVLKGDEEITLGEFEDRVANSHHEHAFDACAMGLIHLTRNSDVKRLVL